MTIWNSIKTGNKKLWQQVMGRTAKVQSQDRSLCPPTNTLNAGTQSIGQKRITPIDMNAIRQTRIDINAPEIEEAIGQLKEELGFQRHAKVFEIDKKFERKWNCRIVSEDAYGVRGHVYFPDEQHYTYFLLRFGKSDKATKRWEI